MKKQKISVTVEMETVSKLLARLSTQRKKFKSKSEIIEHAVNEFLVLDSNQNSVESIAGDAK